MKHLLILCGVLILYLNSIGQDLDPQPAIPLGANEGAVKVRGVLYIDSLAYFPILKRLPEAGSLDKFRPRRDGAFVLYHPDTSAAPAVPMVYLDGEWRTFGSVGGSGGSALRDIWVKGPVLLASAAGDTLFTRQVALDSLSRLAISVTGPGGTYDNVTGVITLNGSGPVDEPTFTWTIKDSINTPEVSPVTGVKWLVGDAPTGTFASPTNHAKHIATWNGSIYTYEAAAVGNSLYNQANDVVSQYLAGTWKWVSRQSALIGGNTTNAAIMSIGTKNSKVFSIITNNTPRIDVSAAGAITFKASVYANGVSTRLLNVNASGVVSSVATGTDGQVLTLVSGVPAWAAVTGESTTASQGLTKVGVDIRLGGSITANSTIATAGNKVIIETATAASNPFQVNSTTGNAINVTSSGGIGFNYTGNGLAFSGVNTSGGVIYAKGTNAPVVEQIQSENANAAGITQASSFSRTTTVTAANGIGISFLYQVETDNGTQDLTNELISEWEEAAFATRKSKFSIRTNNNGTQNIKFVLNSVGMLTLAGYASTSLVDFGTPTYMIVSDASGNIFKTALPSGGGSVPTFVNNEESTGSTSSTITPAHSYTVGSMKLFKNGIRLENAEFTASSGTSITLTSARLTTDVFKLEYYY